MPEWSAERAISQAGETIKTLLWQIPSALCKYVNGNQYKIRYIRKTINGQKLNTILYNKKLQILILAGIVLLLYVRTLNHEFIGLDEHSLLITKKSFNEKLSNIPKAFFQHVFESEDYMEADGTKKFYRPILTVSFIIDEQFSKDGYAFFRFTNIVFHFLSVLGLFFLLQNIKTNQPLAFLLSLLFAVHPLLVQAIAWIPGRNDSMVCAFALWSMIFLVKQQIQKQTNEIANMFLHILLLIAALFTKENALMLFPLFVLWIFSNNNEFLLKKKLVLIASYIMISGLWFISWKNAVGNFTFFSNNGSIYYSFLDNFPLVLQYFQKTIIPVNLSVMASVNDTNFFLVFVSLILFGAGIYFSKQIAWKEILFGLLWFFLFLLPTLLFSFFEGMEHRSYLPAAGIIIATAFLEPVKNLFQTYNPKSSILKFQKMKLVIFSVVITIFTVVTFLRIPVFSSELNYWKNAYETSEHSAVVCRDYGVILTKIGSYEEAEKVYLEGIRRDPKEKLLHYNLGVMYYQMNRFEDAKRQLALELIIDHKNFMAYHVMGVVYKKQMRMQEASLMWEQAVSINPGFAESYKELLSYYSQIKDTTNFIRCRNELEKLGFKIVKK